MQSGPPRPIPIERPEPAPFVPPGWLRAAPLTRAILICNCAIFAAQVAVAGSLKAVGHIPNRESLVFGANYSAATLFEHRFETLLTACFLHSGALHLAFNMMVLWQAGPIVERFVGAARMGPMYLFSGIVSMATSAVVFWARGVDGFSVGASGAIMGVLAAALVIGWRVEGFRGRLAQSMLRSLGFILVFGIVIGITGGSNIDNAAHVGGALAGAGVAAMWRRRAPYSVRATRAVVGACAFTLIASFAIVAYRDAVDPYAPLLAQERFDLAQRALHANRCSIARQALDATERLVRRDNSVRAVRVMLEAQCRREEMGERLRSP